MIAKRAKIILAAMVALAVVLALLLFLVPSVPEVPGTNTPQTGTTLSR